MKISALRYIILAGLAAALCLVQLPAQTATPPPPTTDRKEEVNVLEAFTVTGTNIRRTDEEKLLPVTTLDLDDLEARAAPTAAELFETITGGGTMALNETNVLGADARGDNAAFNLRGIGSGNTLVLLNGRRLAPHPISMAEDGVPSLSVNANQLPTFAASKIEILRDGSSAIYGSDAAAGVVNTLLRTDYNGFSIGGTAGFSEGKGGSDWRSTISWGKKVNGGRTDLTFAFDYYRRDMLRNSDRKWSADSDLRSRAPAPWNGQPIVDSAGTVVRDNDFDNSSTASQYGNFIRGAFDATGTFVGSRPANNTGTTTVTTPSTTAKLTTAGIFYFSPLAEGGTGFRTTAPSRNIDSIENGYYYNLNQNYALQPETGRGTFMGQVDHKISDRLAARGELFFYDARSTTIRDPVGVDGQDDFNIYVGANNPWNPYGSRFYNATGAPNADGSRRLVGTPADVLVAPSTGVRPREIQGAARAHPFPGDAIRGRAARQSLGRFRVAHRDCVWPRRHAR